MMEEEIRRLYVRSVHLEKEIPEDHYLKNIPAVRQLGKQDLVFDSPISIFIGENGTGKSTILEAIAVASRYNPEGGNRNMSFSTKDSHSDLHEYIRIAKNLHEKDGFFLRAESFYNVATYINEVAYDKYYGGPLHEMSHGESFLSRVKNRFEGHGLYLLDEPEAALSPQRLMTLLVYIHDLISEESQFIIATHSPIIMSYPSADLFEFSDEGIRKVRYQDTDHYKIMKDFIEKPEVMYHHLFD